MSIRISMPIIIFMIMFYVLSCSAQNIELDLVCHLNTQKPQDLNKNAMRRLEISTDGISLYETSKRLYNVKEEDIELIYAKRLPDDVYRLSVELKDEEKSLILLGNSDENCLHILSTYNSNLMPALF